VSAAADDPVQVARRGNEWFAGVPYPILRRTIVEAEDWDGAVAEFDREGYPIADLIHPEIELDVTELPGGATLPSGRGRDVWLRFWQEWLEPWEELEIEHSGYESRGRRALVDVSVTARGRLSGASVSLPFTQVWTVEGESAVGYRVFPNRRKAIEALDRER
jgi:SnoaL-like domain